MHEVCNLLIRYLLISVSMALLMYSSFDALNVISISTFYSIEIKIVLSLYYIKRPKLVTSEAENSLRYAWFRYFSSVLLLFYRHLKLVKLDICILYGLFAD